MGLGLGLGEGFLYKGTVLIAAVRASRVLEVKAAEMLVCQKPTGEPPVGMLESTQTGDFRSTWQPPAFPWWWWAGWVLAARGVLISPMCPSCAGIYGQLLSMRFKAI